jgi:CcmD family protein
MVPDTFPALFSGYTFIWAVLAFYIVLMGQRLRRLERGQEKENDWKRRPSK